MSLDRLEESAREPQTSPSCSVVVPAKLSSLNSPFHPSLRREQQQPPCDTMSDANMSDSKGKGVSKPMLIRGREAVISQDDILSQGSATPSPLVVDPVLDLNLSPLSLDPLSLPASSFDNSYFDPLVSADGDNIGVSSGKGKARELPPILPPLSFFPTDYSTENFEWPSLDLSPIAGPSSYGSGSTIEGSESSPSTSTTPGTEEPTAVLAHVPSRCRSLSNLSTRSGRSLSALSLSKVKVKFTGSKAPGNLARKLLFRKRDGSESPESSARDVDGVAVVMDTDLQGCYSLGQGNCLMPWPRDLKSRASVVESPVLDYNMGLGSNPILSMYPAGRPSDAAILRAKSRSYSSPLPTSAFDIVPITPVDIFAPTPVSIPDYFDEYLPREVRLHILAILVELYEAEHLRNIRNGTWTVLKASSSRHRWVGRERGVRELFKLCRVVSKSWRTLVFDGQLWAELDLRSFPKIPPSVLAQLSESAGAFIKHIDFTGHTELFPSSLLDITTHLCLEPTLLHNSHTHLTTVKLQGCTALTTSSLHELLTRSPSLQKLCLKGLTAVTNTNLRVFIGMLFED
ncbi:hypothetical protein A0H81_01299 [Grifola frondosa]|uniref:Uncharacterized protein n=1 Tax=Grifola frondosa TaxID=5627 RepID=A0A1C7MPT1_GRIFR|nr:hypothetical protein A0H81_01299 [Grifola frondosa]